MITNIEHKEVWNSEGKCWDAIITWKQSGVPNKVVCGNNSIIAKTITIELVKAQCSEKTNTIIKYRGKNEKN